ncbi:Glycosyl hydrolase family 36 C-terminal domain-containing protein [Cryptosporangium aurantiacum]|uniref:Glycosyl hydrolase family 36 C-terminal domain-containing protein n=1 Tax=Cryptosporangium aurantiacum TaxID=134849 RepID=A0A1M7QSA0_9ACTN|nr:GH36 C-terminal domain-containing protein [Cryptosporangium aurantiacum]SHN34519.1 Glycosyl hydrolase family 36 C-terminal domain-containing protein [Cryptosporangium aurantiacum]
MRWTPIESCAAGGTRVDLATAARTDVLWPSDNTAPMDRLRIRHGDVRLPLRGLEPGARYRSADGVYSGAHLTAVGLPVRWTQARDAEMTVLEAE